MASKKGFAVVKKNARIKIDDNLDIVIRATPDDSDEQKNAFIVDFLSYNINHNKYMLISRALTRQELGKVLKLKKGEYLQVI